MLSVFHLISTEGDCLNNSGVLSVVVTVTPLLFDKRGRSGILLSIANNMRTAVEAECRQRSTSPALLPRDFSRATDCPGPHDVPSPGITIRHRELQTKQDDRPS